MTALWVWVGCIILFGVGHELSRIVARLDRIARALEAKEKS